MKLKKKLFEISSPYTHILISPSLFFLPCRESNMLISFVLKKIKNSLVLHKLAFFNFEKMRTLGAKIIDTLP